MIVAQQSSDLGIQGIWVDTIGKPVKNDFLAHDANSGMDYLENTMAPLSIQYQKWNALLQEVFRQLGFWQDCRSKTVAYQIKSIFVNAPLAALCIKIARQLIGSAWLNFILPQKK